MKKYFAIFSLTVKEYFVYRLNFILWRVRVFINLLILFFLWSSVFEKNPQFGSYSRDSMLSYIIYANIISNFVLGTRTPEIAGYINDGKIINDLLKPVSFFTYYFTRDLADKAVNMFFFFFELALIILLFHPNIHLPKNIILGIIFLTNGVLISYFANLLLSFIGFWTTEVWSPRFLFMMLLFFVTGSYFPLDLLPAPIFYLLSLTPFPYFFYLPTKVLLTNITAEQFATVSIYQLAFFSFFWVFITWYLAKFAWVKGNKSFSFWGR